MHALDWLHDWLHERGRILRGAIQPIASVHFYHSRFRSRYRGLCDRALIVLIIARVKAVNICFITPQTFLNTVLLLLSYRPECYNPRSTRIQIANTFSVLHVVSCNPKWLQTINLSSSYTQRTSGYCTPCASLSD